MFRKPKFSNISARRDTPTIKVLAVTLECCSTSDIVKPPPCEADVTPALMNLKISCCTSQESIAAVGHLDRAVAWHLSHTSHGRQSQIRGCLT